MMRGGGKLPRIHLHLRHPALLAHGRRGQDSSSAVSPREIFNSEIV
jgi:hypothetical protein